MNKLKILLQAIIGNLCKIRVWFHIWLNIKPTRSEKVAENVVVSLTSYGRRIAKCAPYTIFSLIVQTVRPEKITLWLDKEKWNDHNLPFALKRMQSWGMVDVEYCKDIRSFTKLIPALKKYPGKAIITVDDDIYYSKELISTLYSNHISYPYSIITMIYGSYEYGDKKYNFPLGTGGVLYPHKVLSEKVFDEQLFMDLCPSLDDLWFFVMSLLNKNEIIYNNNPINYYYTDMFYQKTHQGSRLYDVVKKENQKILWNLLQYFNLEK